MQLGLPLPERLDASIHEPVRVPQPRRLAVVGLFAGIGGLEKGLHDAGHHALSLCEIDPGALEVLRRRFASVPTQTDVRELAELPRELELLVAGFPCQDLSQAGRTRGIGGENSGLVGHVFRLLESRRVPLVLLENVPFMLQLDRGRGMELLTDEFERLGYRWAYRVVDTRAFGIPQRRQRVLFLAALHEDPRAVLFAEDAGEPPEPVFDGTLACGFYWTEGVRGLGWAVDAVPTLKGGSTVGVPSPPAIWLPDGRIATPHIRDAERLQGFPADWTQPAERVVRHGHRWKLVGNAVSVPVARWVGEQLARPALADTVTLRRSKPLLRGSGWPTAAWNVGDGRCTAPVSRWPRQEPRRELATFLNEEPKLLSGRATRGFLARARRGTLRFPPGFLEAVEAHLQRVTEST